MSLEVLENEQIKNFLNHIEKEYQTEDEVKVLYARKRRLEREILRQLNISGKQYKTLIEQKKKMLSLEINFDPEIIKVINLIHREIYKNTTDIRKKISDNKKKLTQLHKQNREYFHKYLKPLL